MCGSGLNGSKNMKAFPTRKPLTVDFRPLTPEERKFYW